MMECKRQWNVKVMEFVGLAKVFFKGRLCFALEAQIFLVISCYRAKVFMT